MGIARRRSPSARMLAVLAGAQLPSLAAALHVAVVIPPGSPSVMMVPLIHGCTDRGHSVSVLAYDNWIDKIKPIAPQASYVSLGPSKRVEMDEQKAGIIWGMPYEVMPFFSSLMISLVLEAMLGWPLNQAAFPEIQRLRPDVMLGCNVFGTTYSLGEAAGVPVVGVAFGPQVWMTAVEAPWSSEPAVGSMFTREEIAASPYLTVMNSGARWLGFGARFVGLLAHNYRRWWLGLGFQSDMFESIYSNPMIIPTLPELSGGYPAGGTAYSVMVGMYDHPAMGGATMAKSAQHAEIIEWLDRHQEQGNNVLYVAFGSELIIDKHRLELLISAFSTLKLNVLWAMKHPPKDLKVPPHIFVTPWSPQKAVLSHKAVKAFLSHGGANSLRESLAAGTPIMVMVVMPDSGLNAVLHEKLGVAMRLSKNNITAEAIGGAFRHLCSEAVQARAEGVRELNERRADLGRAVEVIESTALHKYPMEMPKGNGLGVGVLSSLTFLALTLLVVRCWLRVLGCCFRCCGCRSSGGRVHDKTD